MPSPRIPHACIRCGKTHQTSQSELNRGRGQYCGPSCALQARLAVTGAISKVVVCRGCGIARKAGPRAKPDALCHACIGSLSGKVNRKGWEFRPQTLSQRESLMPKESWWICPREEWSQRIAEQEPRLHQVGPEAVPGGWPVRNPTVREVEKP
jgi:hypothetical protein